MFVTANDLQRYLAQIRSRATRARTQFNNLIRSTQVKRATTETVAAINRYLSEAAKNAREISALLDKLAR